MLAATTTFGRFTQARFAYARDGPVFSCANHLRMTLSDELARYRGANDRERAMVAEVAAFLDEHDDAFERSQLLGHITASAWIVDRERAHALLTHHRKLGRWLQLGGHVDGQPDVRAAALREAQEESGLVEIVALGTAIYDVDVHVIPVRGAEPEHKHYDIRFAFEADRAAPLVVSGESHALAWVALDELDRYETDESVRRLARKTERLAGSGGA